MKTKKNSSNLKIITTSLAIAFGITFFDPANAQKSKNYIPEIGWNSRLSSMGLDEIENIGESYSFFCQPALDDLIHAPIWGTKVYTINSGICSTAVHSGIISEQEGGNVTIKLLEGERFYTGSRQNEIVSKDHRTTKLSFTFTGKKNVENEPPVTQASQEDKNSSGIEKVLAAGVEKGLERSIQKVFNNILD